ncbi:GDSL-type esterase/lipase family protein [Danxiaibacter flavus]|uniref:GDSL-type esterase/lipase family protein n=1 Tax=Danxiaibacter flavus TaxID=3049108 RepID=A0ABV3ZQR4_9BACT|nr:GDSL-type esterase/lipase family protein [Chitinophagaceae bacterium DXS]
MHLFLPYTSNRTIFSSQKNRAILFLIMMLGATTVFSQQQKKLDIVFIGNSITHGAGLANPTTDAPPVHASNYLKKQFSDVQFSNQGVSGFTTVDFLPSTNTAFQKVEQAAATYANDKDATLVFSMILGTNDSAIEGPNGSPVSPASYEENVKAIIDHLLKDFPKCKIVLHRPIWYSPNTYNGSKYLQEGLDRLQSYFPVLDKIVKEYTSTHPEQVFAGDKDAFNYFRKNYKTLFKYEKGNAGTFFLHPNEKGAEKLGMFWGKAIAKNLH